MKKVTELLEKYVQWVALGLGAVYLLWMIFAYVMQPPATLQLKNKTVTPVSIEEQIVGIDGPLPKLRTAMAEKSQQNFVVQPYATWIQRGMAWQTPDGKPRQFALFDRPFISSPYRPIVIAPTRDVAVTNPQVPLPPQGAGLAVLPELPAGTPVGVSNGKALVVLPAPNQPAAPVRQPPGRPGPAGAIPANAVDRNWQVPTFKIPMQLVDQGFQSAKVPDALQTVFLRVEIVREELDQNGQWVADPTPIPASANLVVMNLPTPGDAKDEAQYLTWVQGRQPDILHPPYLQIVGGEQWHLPVVTADAAGAAFDPATFHGDPKTLSPRDLATWQRHLKQKADEKAKNARKPNPTRRSPARGGDPGYAPIDAERPMQLAQARGLPRGLPRGGSTNCEPELDMPADAPPVVEEPPANVPAPIEAGPCPSGLFQVFNFNDITVWANDDTARPNRSYRYKMRYALLNPLYHMANVAKNPKDTLVFTLWSPFSAPTDPISVSANVEYFVKNVGFDRSSVTLTVFRWANGRWQSKEFRVAPGDMIGGPDQASGIDYTTNATLVMVRESEPVQAIIADSAGKLVKRDTSDQRNPNFQRLKGQADEAAKLAGPVTAGR